MMTNDHGALTLSACISSHLRLECCRGGVWQVMPLRPEGGRWTVANEGVHGSLELTAVGEGAWQYHLTLDATELTRLRLTLELPGIDGAFHIIPGVLFGDNNLEHAGPGHFPNLTAARAETPSCSPYWEMRADRAALPLSLLCFDGGVAAVSIEPYTDQPGVPAGFIRNGVFARVAHAGLPHAVGVTFGYRNDPLTFSNKDTWFPSTEHRLARGAVQGRIYLRRASDRRAAHDIMRAEYARFRECPQSSLGAPEAVRAIVAAFMEVNWSEARQDFTDQATPSPGVLPLAAWRGLPEIGWTGGGPVGFPIMRAGLELGIDEAFAKGRGKLDRIAKSFNPASGLLWDIYHPESGIGPGVDGWWAGYLVKDCHCAYTNGSAVSYLLQGYAYLHERIGTAPEPWLVTGCRVLDTMLALQEPSGSFGYSYRTDRPERVEGRGYAGVWFVGALVRAFQFTRKPVYLAAAEKAFGCYHTFVRDLCCWGTPVDTAWAPDEEGVLGFIRAAALLHRVTGKDEYLKALGEGAEYEYLWRYGFRARPQAPPLKGSGWNSCGGSGTSVSNAHVHPMAQIVAAELRYLAEQTGDAYHRARMEDGLQWALNTLALYPDVTGYGRLGVMSERFCPSDGLLEEHYPDGTPASTWFTYHGWGAAAALEGLMEK